MLLYSYKTEIAKLNMKKKGLEIDLLQSPNSEKILNKLKNIDNEIKFYENKIKTEGDPGVRII